MPQEKVIILIPTYNEADNIEQTIRLILEHTESLQDFQVEVLVFDSHSQDETAALVQRLCTDNARVHFACEPHKTGLGSAYWQAMQLALNEYQADIIFEFDADGSHQPHYIPAMLELLKTHDVVVGSRYIPGGSMPVDWGLNRKLLSKGGNWVARLIMTPRYKDITSGFRGTRSHFLKKVLPQSFLSKQYAYKLHLYWLLHAAGARIAEFPIEFIDRTKGDSKLPKNSIVDSLKVLLKLRFQSLRQYLMMCLVGCLGAAIQFSLYNGLRSLYYSPFTASQIAVTAAILTNFIFNNRFTFKKSALNFKNLAFLKRFPPFLLYSVAMVYLQSFWVKQGVERFGHGALKENLILIVGIYLGSLVNYFFYTHFIWRQPKNLSSQSLTN